MPHLFVHGLQVAARGAGGGVHPLLNDAHPLADDADLLLEILLRGGEHGAPRGGVVPLRLERGQLPFHGGQSRRLDERRTPVLELRDGGVEVLDGEQTRQVVGHSVASYSARASGSASISAGSAIRSASSQLHQQASGLSSGGGMGSASAPSSR